MRHFALSAMGADRPGIVAAVTAVLVGSGCNLEDTSMAILRGHFSMMLVVAGPDDLTATTLEAALADAAEGMAVAVRDIDDEVPSSPAGDSWTLSVYGADRPGIVHRVASLLAESDVNIVDLTTRVIGGDERPVYAMVLDVTLPSGVDAGEIDTRLQALAVELGVSCSLHGADADIL